MDNQYYPTNMGVPSRGTYVWNQPSSTIQWVQGAPKRFFLLIIRKVIE